VKCSAAGHDALRMSTRSYTASRCTGSLLVHVTRSADQIS
jgi:hypothetical protein